MPTMTQRGCHPPPAHGCGRRAALRLRALGWLLVLIGLAAVSLAILRQPARRRAAPAAGPHLTWLTTADGERRGLLIRSQLGDDAEAWQLWGAAAGHSPLAPLTELIPSLEAQPAVAFNGGYWNEHEHPVGVCAGEPGIFSSTSHGEGAALAGGRLHIGPMVSRIRLALDDASGSQSAATLLQINPRPLPRRTPCLIDPRAYPWPLAPEEPRMVAWLKPEASGALRYNTTRTFRIERFEQTPGGGLPIASPPSGTLLWVQPPAADEPTSPTSALPAPGTRMRLTLDLATVQGEVRWATCAGPRLLRNGQLTGGLDARRTPRTVLGSAQDGHEMLVLLLDRGIDGQPGVSLEEAARELLRAGARDAINLDGGSSTSIHISGEPGTLAELLFPARWPIHHALILRKQAM